MHALSWFSISTAYALGSRNVRRSAYPAGWYAETDWDQILVLYHALLTVWSTPVVALNRAVAVAMVDVPATAPAEVEVLEQDERLAGYRYLPAVKADLLRRPGRAEDAVVAYEWAIALSDNDAERAFLADRLTAARGPTRGS